MNKYSRKCLCKPGRSFFNGIYPKQLYILHKSHGAEKHLSNAMFFSSQAHFFQLQCIMMKWIPGRLSMETGRLSPKTLSLCLSFQATSLGENHLHFKWTHKHCSYVSVKENNPGKAIVIDRNFLLNMNRTLFFHLFFACHFSLHFFFFFCINALKIS